MNISLPIELRDWVQDQVRDGGFGTASEFLRDVLRRERAAAARRRVDARLLSAMKTPVEPVTESDWADIERLAKQKVSASKTAKSKSRTKKSA